MNIATPSESAHDTLVRVMLQAWAGEPLPDFESAEYTHFQAALQGVIGEAKPLDMQRLGCAAARALLQYLTNGLQAQRAAALAELKARGGMH